MSKHAPSKWIEVDENGVGWEMEVVQASHSTVFDQHDRTIRRELPVAIANYCCPVPGCESREFLPITRNEDGPSGIVQSGHWRDERIGPQQRSPFHVTRHVITGYYCPGCTIQFADPAKFSLHKPAEIIPPMATEKPMFPGLELSNEDKAELGKIGL